MGSPRRSLNPATSLWYWRSVRSKPQSQSDFVQGGSLGVDAAVELLRADPSAVALVQDAYYAGTANEAASRFHASPEFAEVLKWTGSPEGKVVLDVGAGRGIATAAFLGAGAAHVHALEPGDGELVGRGAIASLELGDRVTIHSCGAETLPLPDASVDIIYVRQVLHHVHDLPQVLREFRRVCAPGGCIFATREHVAENEAERIAFLKRHPLHQLSGGENAFPLSHYLGAFTGAGCLDPIVLGPWDSLINAFPLLLEASELAHPLMPIVRRRLGGGRHGSPRCLGWSHCCSPC